MIDWSWLSFFTGSAVTLILVFIWGLMAAGSWADDQAEEMARRSRERRRNLNRDIIDLDDRRGVTEQPERGRGA